MPFHLEKGPLGLRMDYMAKVPAIREEALSRLQAGDSPWEVGSALEVNGVTISLFNHNRNDFAARLDQISGNATMQFYDEEMSLGAAYLEEQSLLRPLNRDSTGNREKFVEWWTDKGEGNVALEDAIRNALIDALQPLETELDVWWECTLHEPDPGVAVSKQFTEVTRLMFRTDHTPVVREVAGQAPRAPDL
jgi:hypothetical protein